MSLQLALHWIEFSCVYVYGSDGIGLYVRWMETVSAPGLYIGWLFGKEASEGP